MMAILNPWPSSRQPMDADARPLPREETTPPVTKMYLVGTALLLAHASRARGQEAPDAIEILGRVHGHASLAVERHDPDRHAGLQGTELLEPLDLLERRRGQRYQPQQGFAPVDVEPHVLPRHPSGQGGGGGGAQVAGRVE